MRWVIAVFLVVLCATLMVQARYLEENTEYVEDCFILKVWPNSGSLEPSFDGEATAVSDAYLTALNQKWEVINVDRLFKTKPSKSTAEFDMPSYWRFTLERPADMEAVLADYALAPIVQYVEPIGIHKVTYSPNDPYWSNQWYIRNTGGDHDIDAVEGWDVERGDTVAILGIVDTGVQYSHPDLRERMWRNWTEVNGSGGSDDDGNGFIDDTVGWDWVHGVTGCAASEDCSGEDADPKDYNGHGTHCSGIAAAQTNNSTGVAGIAGGGSGSTGARIMALRAGWESSGGQGYVRMDFCAEAIDYGRDKGVCAINCSWGSSNSGGIATAIGSAVSAGIVICVAAGNDHTSSQSSNYLSTRGDCIDVAATDSDDHKWYWYPGAGSNYGTWVDVSAPGDDIYSTYSNHYTNTYTYLTGTSMAAPCVVGEVGLLKSLYPAWDRDEITDAIINNVDNIDALNPGYEGLLGSGRINVNKALTSSGSITVTAPDGGESWVIDDWETITWTSVNYSGDVDITVNRNYPGGFWDNIITNTSNDGSHSWQVTGFATTTARIRIMASTNPDVGDTSDANFTITESAATITVTSPNGGETWFTDDSENITWTSSGVTGNVKIELNRTYPSGGWEPLYSSTPNDGSQSWTVTSPTTTQARIRVSSVSEPTVNDVSNADFTITEPYITVIEPNGGEVWYENDTETFTWDGVGVTGNVKIEINRDYPSGFWEELYAAVPFNYYAQDWDVTGPGTEDARLRITSVSEPSISDNSDGDFTIIEVGPPTILHDPLDDGEPGTVLVVASALDDESVTMKIFHRVEGAGTWDSTSMSPTATPDEFSATLGPLDAGTYEYYLRALDASSNSSTTDVYDFELYPSCGAEIAYDDGSADRYNWAGEEEFRWAVRFTPASTPFVLCGAQFSVSRISPDSAHSRIRIDVFDDNAGQPGALLFTDVTGSIGNVEGGLPPDQTYWADVVIRDGSDEPLVLYDDFFIAVGNPDTLIYEAFSRDTTSANSNRSFLYDGCEELWYNENDAWENCKVGNRMIRALGYYEEPPEVVVYHSGNDAELNWTSTGAPYYRIYSATTPYGTYSTLEGSTSDTQFIDTNATSSSKKFYRVVSATLP